MDASKGTHVSGYHGGDVGLAAWSMAMQFLFAYILKTTGDYIATKTWT